jgi:hypothetical protein
MYTLSMRRIQIYIDEEMDEVLQAEAASRGQSKAALIRECVSSRYGRRQPRDGDPLTALIGSVDVEPADVDDVVYGR